MLEPSTDVGRKGGWGWGLVGAPDLGVYKKYCYTILLGPFLTFRRDRIKSDVVVVVVVFFRRPAPGHRPHTTLHPHPANPRTPEPFLQPTKILTTEGAPLYPSSSNKNRDPKKSEHG